MVSTDEQIKKNIEEQLAWDSRIDSTEVNVEVFNGEAKLFGTVPSASARQAAAMDTLNVPGVIALENNLTIKYPPAIKVPTDTEIKSNIENLLMWNPNINEVKIELEVDAGVVTLKGSTDTYWKKIKVENLAYDVTGVIDVTNEITVVPTESYVDESIAEDIVDALERNNNIDVDLVDVKVEEGIVTLTGTVSDWYASQTAKDIAQYTPGVLDANNKLTVRE